MRHSVYRQAGKRIVDISIVLATLPVVLPLILCVSLLVRCQLGRPVLFRQQRPGRRGKPFTLYKFRTMSDQKNLHGETLSDEERLTRWGRFLRSTSLDELPELWNVLRGDMSLVGPRPLLTKYLELYTPEQCRRHGVRPGLTGWAQVNGRNNVDWDQKFRYDVWYVDHFGLWLDVKILLRTLLTVGRRENISAQNHATAPEFRGRTEGLVRETRPSPEGIAVIGAGGHAKVVIATLEDAGLNVTGLYDDNPRLWGQSIAGVPVVGPVGALASQIGCRAVIGVGDIPARKKLARQLDLDWVSVIHPRAYVHPSVQLGRGTVVFAGAVIQPEARVGAHAIVNTAASIDHDCSLGDFVHIGPGAHLAGSVQAGAGVFFGVGSCAIPGVSIGENTLVGAGAVVTRSLPASAVAVGTPARVLRYRDLLAKAA